jgi:hypothetical protein
MLTKPCPLPQSRSHARVASRSVAVVRSRSGFSSQCFRQRLPMPVWAVSSRLNSVGAVSPRSVCVNSRLRRVVAGRLMSVCGRATCNCVACANARPCVCSAKSSKALTAACACGSPSASHAARLAACNWASSFWRPSVASNCQAGRGVRLRAAPWPASRRGRACRRPSNAVVTSAPYSSSVGLMRATQAGRSSVEHSAN